VWTAEELRRFLGRVSGHRLSLACQLLATTGMRRSELLGLRLGDVDWDRGALSVVRSLGLVDGELLMSPGKTATSRRLVFLDSVTLDDLGSHFQRAVDDGVGGDSDAVFASRDGGLFHPDSFSNTFDCLVAAGGCPGSVYTTAAHLFVFGAAGRVSANRGLAASAIAQLEARSLHSVQLGTVRRYFEALGYELAVSVAPIEAFTRHDSR
jgi:hypothetical protein